MKDFFDGHETPKPESVPTGDAFAVVLLKGTRDKQFTVWHPTLESAKHEAERLAATTNSTYGVIQLLGIMQPAQRPVAWIPATSNSE
jgi:hypothetical protein